MSDVSWLKAIILGLIPGGQLYARVFLLDGSLDKMWLLIPIFLFPPFGLVFSIMWKLGKIAKGKGGKPYDWFMLIPVIAKFLLATIIPKLLSVFYNEEEDEEPGDTAIFITSFIIQILINMIPFLIRMINICKKFEFNFIGKSIVDGTFASFAGIIIPIILGFVPFVGTFLSIIEYIPVIGDFANDIIWSFGFIFAYVIVNMFNGDDIKEMCATGFFGKNKFESTAFFVVFILTLIIKTIF